MTKQDVEIPSVYKDEREIWLKYAANGETALTIANIFEDHSYELLAWVKQADMLDALAQIGWLPDEYRKPEPISPREAKIREVVTALANSDSDRGFTVEEYGKHLSGDWDSSAYRENAEALIDAGLVQLDD